MAAHLRQPQLSVDMEAVVQTALSRGYTAQGEMFSGKKTFVNCFGPVSLNKMRSQSKELHVSLLDGAQRMFSELCILVKD